MQRLPWFVSGLALLALVLSLGGVAVGQGVSVSVVDRKQAACSSSSTGTALSGICTEATGLNSAQYTGWFEIDGFKSADFGATFTDANDSVTALNVLCFTSNSNSGANGTGYEVCSVKLESGTATYTCPMTISLTTGTAEVWSFTVENLTRKYMNCSFTATGTPAAADTLLLDVELRR